MLRGKHDCSQLNEAKREEDFLTTLKSDSQSVPQKYIDILTHAIQYNTEFMSTPEAHSGLELESTQWVGVHLFLGCQPWVKVGVSRVSALGQGWSFHSVSLGPRLEFL